MDYSTMASRLLCDLPQPKRILSTSDATGAPSLLQGSSMSSAVNQLDNNNNSNKMSSSIDSSTKRLLEELTLSRLVNLQKQREDTIIAYLAMERSGGSQGSRIGNNGSQNDGVSISSAVAPSQQLQRLLNMNSSSSNPLPMANSGSANSLLLQLNNNSSGRNGNNMNRSPGNHHPLRAFNTF